MARFKRMVVLNLVIWTCLWILVATGFSYRILVWEMSVLPNSIFEIGRGLASSAPSLSVEDMAEEVLRWIREAHAQAMAVIRTCG